MTGSLNADLLGEPVRACSDPGVELRIPDRYHDAVWSTSDTGATIRPSETGWYTVSASDSAGCIITDSVHVDLENCACTVYLPNAFTPNGDGINEGFCPIFNIPAFADEYGFMIFDRWGLLIFDSNTIGEHWNGQLNNVEVPEDVYVWKMHCRDIITKEVYDMIGHVTVVR